MSILFRIILWIISGCVFLLISGIAIEQMRVIARKNYKPDGVFANVGNHKLHYLIKGTGSPAVVFESGLDLGGHIPWMHIQNEISKYTTAISYDRAGILWSERGENPKTGRAMSMELEKLLSVIQCPKPYILVAHSLAGITLRRFIQDNRDDIAGIVFIDVTHPNQRKAVEEELNEKVESPNPGMIKFLFFSGIYRLINKPPYSCLSHEDPVNLISGKNRYLSINASMEESENIQYFQDKADTDMTFGSILLCIISSNPTLSGIRFPGSVMQKAYISVRNELQRDLLNLSTRSTWCYAEKSGHYVHHSQPELVLEQILKMIPHTESKRK